MPREWNQQRAYDMITYLNTKLQHLEIDEARFYIVDWKVLHYDAQERF